LLLFEERAVQGVAERRRRQNSHVRGARTSGSYEQVILVLMVLVRWRPSVGLCRPIRSIATRIALDTLNRARSPAEGVLRSRPCNPTIWRSSRARNSVSRRAFAARSRSL